MFILGYCNFFTTTVFNDSSHIPMLFDKNYTEWKDKILLTLGCIDLDLAFHENEPPIPMNPSSSNEKVTYER